MSEFDDRARRAREDLESGFHDVRAPEFAAVRARQRHRHVAYGGVAAMVLVAVALIARRECRW
jgi:hypothetical protein